ncbi:hypothetical protein AMATHDRAFT_55886 [Amanita thiersii Skay4041]|uniref:Uncharacterized protein n=1 Tax=Amanita thiersii Skay4041 TaxID=703135 RepID=A0A2A9NSA8_9AGAR|nr:hypothetical protein AMATHDRAFT_55886 [Amanita thiersii Skay4041]
MKSFLSLATVAFAAVGAYAQGQLTINTPSNPVVCQPLLLTWSGGSPPYFLSIHPGSDPNGASIQDFPQQTGTSLTWTVNIAAGTQIGLSLRDNTGNTAQSAAFTINPGSDTACVGKPPDVSGGASSGATGATSSAGSGSASAPSTASTSAALTTAPATSATVSRPASSGSASGSSSATRSGSSSTASASSAANANAAKVGTAGLVGAALVALLA